MLDNCKLLYQLIKTQYQTLTCQLLYMIVLSNTFTVRFAIEICYTYSMGRQGQIRTGRTAGWHHERLVWLRKYSDALKANKKRMSTMTCELVKQKTIIHFKQKPPQSTSVGVDFYHSMRKLYISKFQKDDVNTYNKRDPFIMQVPIQGEVFPLIRWTKNNFPTDSSFLSRLVTRYDHGFLVVTLKDAENLNVLANRRISTCVKVNLNAMNVCQFTPFIKHNMFI